MKIKFTITLSNTTVAGFAAQGFSTAQQIIPELKDALQERLDDANQSAPDMDDELEELDLD